MNRIKDFKWKQPEILPPLAPGQVRNLIKFLRLNVSTLTNLIEYESCCANDDADFLQGMVYNTLELAYGTEEELNQWVKDNIGNEDEDEEEDEDDE